MKTMVFSKHFMSVVSNDFFQKMELCQKATDFISILKFLSEEWSIQNSVFVIHLYFSSVN